jgi:hypothetical protein
MYVFQSRQGNIAKVGVEDADVEGLMSGPRPCAPFPEFDLHDRIRPAMARTETEGTLEASSGGGIHNLPVDHAPQLTYFIGSQVALAGPHAQVDRCPAVEHRHRCFSCGSLIAGVPGFNFPGEK